MPTETEWAAESLPSTSWGTETKPTTSWATETLPDTVWGIESAFSIYSPSLFDFVLPSSLPGDEIESLDLCGAKGEFVQGTFAIHAPIVNLEDISIVPSELVGPGDTIATTRIDIRVVKVWEQSSSEVDPSLPDVVVPECLVYDDDDTLLGSFVGNDYTPPTISEDLRTDIPKKTTKQFWVTIEIAPSKLTGTYTGTFTITKSGVGMKVLPVSVDVLDFELLTSTKSFSTSYIIIPDDLLIDSYHTDILDHGITSVNLRTAGVDPSDVGDELALLDTAGFVDPISLFSPYDEYEDLITTVQASAFTYLQGIDEPTIDDAPTEQKSTRHHIRKSKNIHDAGLNVGVPIRFSVAERLRDPDDDIYDQVDPENDPLTFRDQGITGEVPDFPQYGLPSVDDPLFDYIDSLRSGGAKNSGIETVYWQAWVEKPLLNRMMSGNWLWTSGLDGVVPVAYHGAIGGSFRDPNDDFDNTGNRDNNLTYYSTQGPIPTLQYEALRAGIYDIRYLTTLFDLTDTLSATNPSLAASIEAEVNANLLKYYDPLQVDSLEGSDFETTRALVIEKILEVIDALP